MGPIRAKAYKVPSLVVTQIDLGDQCEYSLEGLYITDDSFFKGAGHLWDSSIANEVVYSD